MAFTIVIMSIAMKYIYSWEVRMSPRDFIPSWMLTFISAMGAFCQQGRYKISKLYNYQI